MHNVSIEYNPFIQKTSIAVDGKTASQNCIFAYAFNSPIDTWYSKILSDISTEINASFSLNFSSGDFERTLMRQEAESFSDCKEYKAIDLLSQFSLEQKLGWIKELTGQNLSYSIEISMVIPADEIKSELIQSLRKAGYTLRSANHYYKALAFCSIEVILCDSLSKINSRESYFVFVAKNSAQIEKEISYIQNSTGKGLIIITNSDRYSNNLLSKGIFVISSKKQNCITLFESYIAHIALPLFVQRAQDKVKHIRGNSAISFEQRAKANLISSGNCYLEVSLPQKIELGHKEKIQISVFPQNTSLNVSFFPIGHVHCDGKSIVAIKPGRITATITNSGTTLYSSDIEVFEILKVKQISLYPPDAKHMREGRRFQIKASFFPSNSVNISAQQWTSDNQFIKIDNSGNVTATKGGIATISVAVGTVMERIIINVQPKVTAINLSEQDICLAINDPTRQLQVSVYPNNGYYSSLEHIIFDPDMIEYDPRNGRLLPKYVGCTDIEFTAYDENRVPLAINRCSITIAPTHPGRYGWKKKSK